MAPRFTARIRSLAADIKDITVRLTTPEIQSMLGQLDLSRYDHQIIAISLHGELDDRAARFAELYAAPMKAGGPSVVERVKGWVLGRFRGLRAARVAP